MIDKIYEVIADKTISRWLKVVDEWQEKIISLVFTAWWWKDNVNEKRKEEYYIEFCWWSGDCSYSYVKETMKIIWHPVMIWDVLDWIDKLNQWLWEDHIKVWNSVRHKFDTKIKIIEDKRKEKRKPIEDQSEECIEFVYNLIK